MKEVIKLRLSIDSEDWSDEHIKSFKKEVEEIPDAVFAVKDRYEVIAVVGDIRVIDKTVEILKANYLRYPETVQG